MLLAASAGTVVAGDYNQWRGPNRDGVVPDGVKLADAWPAEGPKLLWESEFIPSNDDGGHGSVVVADGKAYLSVVWHEDKPTETRAIDDLVLRELGYRGTSNLGKELVAKMEADRMSLSPRLRGGKLDEWIANWRSENLDKKQDQVLGSWIESRFKKGKAAFPISVLDRLNQIRKRRFANQEEMEAWVKAQDFGEDLNEKIFRAVPNTMKVASDTVVCLDLESGKTLWKAESPGEATGRNSSSTPSVMDGRVYAVGSTHAYCVDAETGKVIWATELKAQGAATSPLVLGDKVYFVAGGLMALERETGKLAWEQKDVSGNNSSPAIWHHDGKDWLIVNERKSVACVDSENGNVLWHATGGGDSTPAISGDYMVAYSRKEDLGFAGYKLSLTGAEVLWSHVLGARRSQSSPVIVGEYAYLLGADNHLCVNLETGSVAWVDKLRSNITSPLVADGKIYLVSNNGSDLMMLRAGTASREELGKARIKALWCASPCITDGRLLLRAEDKVKCYDLAAK